MGRALHWLLWCLLARAVLNAQGKRPGASGLARFFTSVDTDGDGQIEPHEAEAFMGESFGEDAAHEVHKAISLMKSNLDGSDQGQTISQSEVNEHLHSLLQVGA